MASEYTVERAEEDRRSKLLRRSTVGFVALLGGLVFVYFLLLQIIGSSAQLMWSSSPGILAARIVAPALPGVALTWWVLVVLQRECSALIGGFAALLAIAMGMLSYLMVGFIGGLLMGAPGLTLWQAIVWPFFLLLVGLGYLCTQPWGWGLFVLVVSTGAIYGERVRRRTWPVQESEPMPDTGTPV